MALPPIITNSPFYKALSGTSDPGQPRRAEKAEATEKRSATVQDRIELSPEAQAKIEASEIEDIRTEQAARQIADEVRFVLEHDHALTLGQS